MDTDIGRLIMVTKEKGTEEICPKCHAAYQPGIKECSSCGVIFNKLKPSTLGSHTDSNGAQTDRHAIPAPSQTAANQKISSPLDKRKKLCGILIFLCVIGAGFYSLYVAYIESRIQATSFQEQLFEFCTLEMSKPHLNQVAEGEDTFRTGRILVVSERQEVTLTSDASGKSYTMILDEGIHPAWHMLDRKIRAKKPSDVDTLLRVHKELGKTGRYGKLKTNVFNTHKIVLDVYDWKNRASIGTKVFDPGQGSAFMTEEDYEAMMESVNDRAIAKYIQSMDIHE